MIRRTLVLAATAAAMSSPAFAQDMRDVGAGRVEVSAAPVGGIFFMESSTKTEPKFVNYLFGGSIISNASRWFGIEGDLGFGLGVRQTLSLTDGTLTGQKTPNVLNYSGNAIINLRGSDNHVVPYVAAGLGGLTILQTTDAANLGVTTNQTYLTSNLGGGLRVFGNRHVGVRADYRFMMIRNRAEAPLFFGQENRYAHRLAGSLVFTY